VNASARAVVRISANIESGTACSSTQLHRMRSSLPASSIPHVAASLPELELVARGRYKIEQRLGRGGAASVYRALEVATGRALAIKRLTAGASARLTSLFELEYHALAGLKHPNIVEVYDYGADEHGPYYVMELLEGEDLSARGRLSWQEAASYACQVASALSVLHARRLLHRDISARNVWRSPNGELKLIDFGALTSFGTPRDIVGTPPHVAPEALFGRPLDQRADLYGLGALLYWLLTGAHAYPARALRDLPSLWSEPLPSVVERLARHHPESAEALPRELDALVMGLLSENPLARPSSTGEVIDRLSALLGVESQPRAASDIALEQPALVGRERERKHLARGLERLRHGHGEATIYSAPRGAGRTRLLLEFAIDARIAGMSVLHVQAKGCTGPHGVADALVQRLLDVLPELALAAARERAPVLAHLSRRVQERLGQAQLTPLPGAAGEARAHIHAALSELFGGVARESPLVLLIDDLESADESSVSWLMALGQHLGELPIALGLGLCEAQLSENAYAHRALLAQSRRAVLKALDPEDAHKLLASLFGEVPNLRRLSERAHRLTQGLPARLVAAARRLVREGVITNADGTWVLPQDFPDELLGVEREQGVTATLRRLSDPARLLGALLGLWDGPIPIEVCKALSELEPRALFAALEELTREGVLSSAHGGYVFEDELFVSKLRAELTPEAERRAHARLGRFLLAQPLGSKTEELSALAHLLEGGDAPEVPARITRIALDLMRADPDHAIAVAPALERALVRFRELGKRGADLVALLVPLSVSGYFSDLQLAKRYGAEALAAASDALCIEWILKLTPWLGKRLSLTLGFARAALRAAFRRSDCAPGFRESIEMFFHAIAAHAGVSTITVNPSEVARCAHLTSPFTVLGEQHIACFVHEFNTSLWLTMRDHTGHSRQRWQDTLAKLEGTARIANMPEQIRLRYLGGALYALGFLECWRDSAEALRIAESLESFELKMYHMSADQLRTVYYGNQGNRALCEQYKSRAELHAIQRGSAWQIETWAPGAAMTAALRTYDAMALKESYELLLRLQKRIPHMRPLTRRCRGAFLFLRKRFSEALPVLEECLQEAPAGLLGWGRAHGMLAACLNALGQPERALEVCERALRELTSEDLRFPAMNLSLQVEHAHALARLGKAERAAAQLDALLAQHAASEAPLTRGALHEARSRLALLAGDQALCALHASEMERHYGSTGSPSLAARCASFARERRHAFRGELAHGELPSTTEFAATSAHTLERALSQVDGSLETHARLSLSIVGASIDSLQGALYGLLDGRVSLLAALGETSLPRELKAWVEARLAQLEQDDVTQTDFAGELSYDPDVFESGETRWRLFPLRVSTGARELVVGGALFAESAGKRHLVPPTSLHFIAQRVHRDLMASSVRNSLPPKQTDD
jgi:tetratricopeptide (TPR) repeat protein